MVVDFEDWKARKAARNSEPAIPEVIPGQLSLVAEPDQRDDDDQEQDDDPKAAA